MVSRRKSEDLVPENFSSFVSGKADLQKSYDCPKHRYRRTLKHKRLGPYTAIALIQLGKKKLWRYRKEGITQDYQHARFSTLREFENFVREIGWG